MGHDAKVGFLLLLWGSWAFSAVTGVIINPSYRVYRSEDPKDFWITFAVTTVFGIIITVFILTQF